MTPGALVGFLLCAVMLMRPIGAVADLDGQTRMARGTLERLHRVLGERPEPIARAGVALTIRGGEIEFRDVRFAYPGRSPGVERRKVNFPRQSRGLYGLSRSKRLKTPLAACRTELFHILGIVENGRFRLPWRFDLAALAPVDPATGLYL